MITGAYRVPHTLSTLQSSKLTNLSDESARISIQSANLRAQQNAPHMAQATRNSRIHPRQSPYQVAEISRCWSVESAKKMINEFRALKFNTGTGASGDMRSTWPSTYLSTITSPIIMIFELILFIYPFFKLFHFS